MNKFINFPNRRLCGIVCPPVPVGSKEIFSIIIDSMLRTPGCPFVLYVGSKKLVERKEFEKYIFMHIAV